ncbi:MAG TPA: OsmC family protein [Rhodothermales bacterium]|nr:OsmC family protein [Rhodothermales bacterium]
MTEGKWTLVVDMSEKAGGSGRGPDSGVFGRAAFGSCTAISYAQWAAILDVTIQSLEVTVETDADNSGYYDVADVPAGYLRARTLVRIESPDPVEKVIEVLDKGDKHSPYHDLWSRAFEIERTVILNGNEI